MKKFAIILFTITSVAAFGQIEEKEEFKELAINGVLMGATKDELKETFGDPLRFTRDFNEIEDDYLETLYYRQSKLVLLNDKLISFDLKNSEFKIEPYNICVGDNESVLQKYFPKTYKKFEGGTLWIGYNDAFVAFVVRDGSIVNIFLSENS